MSTRATAISMYEDGTSVDKITKYVKYSAETVKGWLGIKIGGVIEKGIVKSD